MVSERRQFVRVIDPNGGDKEGFEASRLLDARKLERHSRRGLRIGDRLLVRESRPVSSGKFRSELSQQDAARLECVNNLEAGLLGRRRLNKRSHPLAGGRYL
jgi:hypothetical protein